MSLLMDALRKAEQQKQKISAQGSTLDIEAEVPSSPLGGGLSLEPMPDKGIPVLEPEPASFPASSPVAPDHLSALPELPSSLEALDEQFMAHAAQSKPAPKPAPPPPPRPTVAPPPPPPIQSAPPPAPQPELARESVRNVFEAKQPQPRRNRNFAIALGLISLVAAVGIGAYFWWQLQPKSNMVATLTPPPPTAPPPAPVATPVPAVVTPPPAPQALTAPPTPTLSSPIASAKAEKDEEEEDAPAPRTRAIKAASTKPPPSAAPALQPETPFRKTTTSEKTDPLLLQAHEAYSRGEPELARQAWQKVLAKDPRNLDALRGLAVVSQQSQQLADAASYYQRALDVDPKDAIALAGLMALKVPTDMVLAESRLKTLLAEQPDSAYLNFALGNQYARQQRWADAQQAYFKAYTAEPGNPGYIFNLAVSLDQLHQAKLAARYYNEALTVAERQPGQPAGFDRTEVIRRLSQLQVVVTP